MREIRESRQQIRFSHRLPFNFAGLGCRSSQAGRFQSTLGGGWCDCRPLASWEKRFVAKQQSGFRFQPQTFNKNSIVRFASKVLLREQKKKIENKWE